MQRRAWTLTLLALAALLSHGCADQPTSIPAAPPVAQLPTTVIDPRLTPVEFHPNGAPDGGSDTSADAMRPMFNTTLEEELKAVIKSAEFKFELPQGLSRATSPAKARFKMNYFGTNAKQAVHYTATPLYSGSTFTDGAEVVGPGDCVVQAATYCAEYKFDHDIDIYGISCGYNVAATGRHAAWMADNRTVTVNFGPFGSLSASGSGVTSSDQTNSHTTVYGAACPKVGSVCPDSGTVYGDDDDTNDGNDFNLVPNVRPSFDCTTGGGGATDDTYTSSNLVQVCITYISGFLYLDTGEIVITSEYTQCWVESRIINASNRVTTGAGLSLNRNAPAGVSVVLIGTGALPGGEPARIVRRRRGEAHDAILVDLGKATPVDLGSAIVGLLALRSGTGEIPGEDFEGVVSVSNLGPRWSTEDEPRVAAQLEQLRTAPERSVAGIGHGRATTISVAPGSYRTVAKFQ